MASTTKDESQRMALPVRETAHGLGIGATKTRELIARGDLESIRIGRRVLVPRASIEKYIRSLLEASAE